MSERRGGQRGWCAGWANRRPCKQMQADRQQTACPPFANLKPQPEAPAPAPALACRPPWERSARKEAPLNSTNWPGATCPASQAFSRPLTPWKKSTLCAMVGGICSPAGTAGIASAAERGGSLEGQGNGAMGRRARKGRLLAGKWSGCGAVAGASKPLNHRTAPHHKPAAASAGSCTPLCSGCPHPSTCSQTSAGAGSRQGRQRGGRLGGRSLHNAET